mmetsp:Transcript_30813/g.35217  ORF Transcript_30813/g.35217 Transcript_30813/m.35217 type:complete len:109 (+) Transcript_30813:111-437(+)
MNILRLSSRISIQLCQWFKSRIFLTWNTFLNKIRIDYINVPYATTEDDMKVAKRLMSFLDQAVFMARLEDKNASILKEADGIIIQRRSLGLSIVSEKLFALQNYLLEQ